MRTKYTDILEDSRRRDLHSRGGISPRKKSTEDNSRVRESMLQFQGDRNHLASTIDDDWLEKEATTRESPLIERLNSRLKQVIHKNEDFVFTHSPDLSANIAQEVARLSRDEPGGVTSCRIHLNVVTREGDTVFKLERDLKAGAKVNSIKLGSTAASSGHFVETSKIEVYLLSTNSLLSRLQAMMTSLSLKSAEGKCRPKFRKATLLSEFVLVKRKLFRSNSSKEVVLVKASVK